MKKRGFEIVSAYAQASISLPVRKTAASAGYDIQAAEDRCLEPHRVSLIATGLKAYMQPDEYLALHVRSGFSVRHAVSCINSQGIIDADYYNNPDNEGHIMIPLINHGEQPVYIAKGTRIAQGIFCKYLTADNESSAGAAVRMGGFGSTGEN
ncbi:MAG: dUTP diphosphatase [Anaerovibrio sp.]|nr:dUTP diphosphatase [Anaerovibrio sp.]